MRLEQRGWIKRLHGQFNWRQKEIMSATKPFNISKGHKTRASLFIEGIAQRQPGLFVHWQRGMIGAFA